MGRREATYRGAVPPQALADATVILADDGIATVPRQFDAVGQVYADFRQVTDEEVRVALRR